LTASSNKLGKEKLEHITGLSVTKRTCLDIVIALYRHVGKMAHIQKQSFI